MHTLTLMKLIWVTESSVLSLSLDLHSLEARPLDPCGPECADLRTNGNSMRCQFIDRRSRTVPSADQNDARHPRNHVEVGERLGSV
jgi:hypothetical protein